MADRASRFVIGLRTKPAGLEFDLPAGVGEGLTAKREIPMSKDGNQFGHAPRGFNQVGGAFSRQFLAGAVAGLLLAGFNYHALATNFTNGDFTPYPQADWGGDPNANPTAELLLANYATVYASTSVCSRLVQRVVPDS